MSSQRFDVEQVREAVDMVAVVGEYVALKPSGNQWQGLCPFHEEKTPSFSVNAEEGFYHCFGCKAGGDVFKFISEVESLPFREALEKLADRSGVTGVPQTGQTHTSSVDRDDLMKAVATATKAYNKWLVSSPEAGPARGWLRSIGFDGKTVMEYQIGWAPSDRSELQSAMNVDEAGSVTPQVFTEAGLGFNGRDGKLRDSFAGQLLFPVLNGKGKPVGFVSQTVADGDEPKHMATKTGTLFKRDRALYGLSSAKHEIVKTGEVVVCDTPTDVIALLGVGVYGTVAPCGSGLTNKHIKELTRLGASRVVLAFDPDRSNTTPPERFPQWEAENNIEVAVMELPAGETPTSLAATDPEWLRACVTDATDFTDYRVEQTLTAYDMADKHQRHRAATEAASKVSDVHGEAIQQRYLLDIADRCSINVSHLQASVTPPHQSAAHRPGPVVTAADMMAI